MPDEKLSPDPNPPRKAAERPKAPFVRLLDNENLSECPADRGLLIQLPADLSYSRDLKGGNAVDLPVMLRFCPACRRWYIDRQRLLNLEKQGVNPRGFDIVGSDAYPRPPAYALWHPAAVPVQTAVQPVPSTARQRGPSPARARVPAAAKPADKNLALKCRSCDGGQTGRSLGFRGVCSQDCYYRNIIERQDPWCAGADNRCRESAPGGGGFPGPGCSESRLFLEWTFAAGPDAAGQDPIAGRPGSGCSGHFAVATVLLPQDSETNRRIFAIYLIGGQEGQAGCSLLKADPRLRLELMADELLYFWKLAPHQGSVDDSRWGRQNWLDLSLDTVILILQKAVKAVKDQDRRVIAEKLFDLACSRVSPEHLKKLLARQRS